MKKAPQWVPWRVDIKLLLWLIYCLVAVFVTILCIDTGNLWFTLAVVLCFIFGPKVFKWL